MVAVIWVVDSHRPYFYGRNFTFITDCAALTWLFNNSVVGFLVDAIRWALRLTGYDMGLQWRPGRATSCHAHCRGSHTSKNQGVTSTTRSWTRRPTLRASHG